MLRIGSMNMQLHGVEGADIRYRDSLASAHGDDADKFSLILANPPFAGSLDFETTRADLLTIVNTKKTELLFMVLFLKQLMPGGLPSSCRTGCCSAHPPRTRLSAGCWWMTTSWTLPSSCRPACSSLMPVSRLNRPGFAGDRLV